MLTLAIGAAILAFAVQPAPLAGKLFAIAYGLDPQRPSHTYALGGALLPLEARKLGMFGGFLIVCLGLFAAGRLDAASFPTRRISVTLVAFIALMALDGTNALFFDLGWPHLYAPDLRLRLATGLLTGLAMAALLVPAANGSLWRDIRLIPSLASYGQLGGALVLCAGFFLLVDARPALLYYPIAVVGIAGLLIEMVLINLILVLTVTRRIALAVTWRDALAPLLLALLLVICELAAMSALRHVTLGDMTRLL